MRLRDDSGRSLDVPRLRKAVEWVLEEAERPKGERGWRQNAWGRGRLLGKSTRVKDDAWGVTWRDVQVSLDCGTSCCVAGNICLTAGDTFIVDEHEARGKGKSKGDKIFVEHVRTSEGNVESIDTRAARLLGLSLRDSWSLFAAGNGVDDVLDIARTIARDAGEELGL